jgi:hypothetical protein
MNSRSCHEYYEGTLASGVDFPVETASRGGRQAGPEAGQPPGSPPCVAVKPGLGSRHVAERSLVAWQVTNVPANPDYS